MTVPAFPSVPEDVAPVARPMRRGRMRSLVLVRDVGRGTGASVTGSACLLAFLGFVGLIVGNGLGLAFALWYWAAWMIYAGFNRPLAGRAFASVLPWIFPAWALLSMLWSRDPTSSARVAIQLMITTGISVMIPYALTARGLLLTLFGALLAGSVIGLATGGSEVIYQGNVEALHGIFGSKNNFAMLAAMLLLTSAGVALDRGFPLLVRCAALLGVLLACYELYQTHSAGSNVAAFFAVSLLLALKVIQLMPVQLRTMVVLVAAGLLFLAVVLAALFLDSSSIDSLLKLLGKNPTLTGRAYLWARAQEIIDAHRWLGVGFQAFWRQGYLDAEGLWRYLMIDARTGVSMHNLYYETTIEVGLIGFALLMIQLAMAMVASMVAAIFRPDGFASVGAAICLFFFTRLFLETDFLAPFSIGTVLFVLIWSHTRRSLVQWRHGAVKEGNDPGRREGLFRPMLEHQFQPSLADGDTKAAPA